MKAPVYTDKVSAAYRAQQISNSMNISYWIAAEPEGDATYHDKDAIEHLKLLAELFGCELTPIKAPEREDAA